MFNNEEFKYNTRMIRNTNSELMFYPSLLPLPALVLVLVPYCLSSSWRFKLWVLQSVQILLTWHEGSQSRVVTDHSTRA